MGSQRVGHSLATKHAQKSLMGFPGGSEVKNLPANAGDMGDLDPIPGLGRSAGERNDSPLQDFCLGNPIDRGGWQATVHGVAKSRTQMKQLSTKHACCLPVGFC